MAVAPVIGGIIVLAVGYLLVRRAASAAEQSPRRPVLPSHYEGLLYSTGGSRSVPGRCDDCGTENDPEYVYCRSCGERL
jgi:hypothetical protein